jgi:hypothetical protein
MNVGLLRSSALAESAKVLDSLACKQLLTHRSRNRPVHAIGQILLIVRA